MTSAEKGQPPYNDPEEWQDPAGVHKTGIRGIQDTRQIDDGKTNDIEINDKKVGSKHLT